MFVIQRKKDIPTLHKSENLIRDYYIKSGEHLLNKWEEITKMADTFQARVYVNISPVSLTKTAISLLRKITDTFEYEQWNKLPHSFRSVISNEKGILKRFIVDFDSPDYEIFLEMKSYFEEYFPESKIEEIIPTKSGWHMICTPFDTGLFGEWITWGYKQKGIVVDVLKNQPTLLYYNEL